VRLVKGAYWGLRKRRRRPERLAVPVFDDKPRPDANFEAQPSFLWNSTSGSAPRSRATTSAASRTRLALAEAARAAGRGYEFQMLYGMADPIKAALVEMGHRVRIYTPYGQLLPGMAYLVRRLLENTSNESFLARADSWKTCPRSSC
jgi:RHH-type proline utilization regulon transcriptional repressor/proline dehydrogenase/delta 1-pyrroline-5-carboxylate dehydrogenase